VERQRPPEQPAGLSELDARRRLAEEGPNALPQARGDGIPALAWKVATEPMFLLLIGAASVYLLLGDVHEALVLAASIAVVLGITVFQERRTERALEALRGLSSPRALVVRDGREMRIAGRDVVRGDLLLLREGDRAPADAILLDAHDVAVDESLLTGESVPVSKARGERVFSGTLMVRGLGRAEVTATGERSELGRIGASLARVESGKTSLERETARIVRILAIFAIVLCGVVALLYYATRGDALGGALAGLTLAMALLPEEFPVVLTVFLALGAWRISKHGVLTRRMAAIEMLGAATVLCCDKTGTLTENRMAVAELWRAGEWRERAEWEAAEAPLIDTAALACEPAPFDPMERAILAVQAADTPVVAEGTRGPPPVLEKRYPLAEGFLAVSHAWRLASGERVLAMKGAPESVLAACDMDEGVRRAALEAAGDAARRGLRILAVARAPVRGAWPERAADARHSFLGLVALADPLRPTVPGAIRLARQAGIRVVMITGDHRETALAIARQAGLDARDAMTGAQLEASGDEALAAAVRNVQVFARVRPEQKLRLVNALRAAGEVVAMTGDGVNDAPALKAAHIGIAMGRRGTDVAREAAALVLLDDDFTSIVGTVRLGRRIYDNIRNAMRYLVAAHVPMAGMALLPFAFGWPLFAFPVHVVFLEFVIDPACSIVFEAERSDPRAMQRAPRRPGERLFSARALALGIALGASVLAAVAAIYGGHLIAGHAESAARAAAFATLVFGNLALIMVNRSTALTALEAMRHENRALWWVLGGATAALATALYVPAVARIFRFEAIGPGALALAAAAGFACVLWYDAVKLLRRR
jgi:Ca2+-transporting ATPase